MFICSIQECINILLSPTTAFSRIKEGIFSSWAPFILIICSLTSVYIFYFSFVDFEWLKGQLLEQFASSNTMTNEEQQTASNFYEKDTLMLSTTIGGGISIIIFNLIAAVYYNLATKVSTKNDFKFTDWYGFTWWTTLPVVISMLVAALVLMFADDSMVSMQDLQPASLNSLIFSVEQSSSWFNFLEGITLFSFWVIGLATVGLASWLNLDTKKAFFIAIGPYAFIYGLWALYIVFAA